MKSLQPLKTVSAVLVTMWLVFALHAVSMGKLNALLSVKPRSPSGLLGILTHPFAHANIGHLIANSIPFFVLSLLIAYSINLSTLLSVWVFGAVGSGLGVWLLSSANVVGASGVVFALIGFILGRCYTYPSLRNVLTALLALFLYSGALLSLFDIWAQGISWLGHVSGFITGIICALYWNKD